MEKILVTGADGQLGKSIQELSASYSKLKFVFKNPKQLDITDSESVNFIFKKEDFSFCINCAAYTNVEQAEKTPEIAYKINAEAVKNLALACKKNNIFLIHISTDYVFDGEKETPYTIHDKPNPINEYGKSKLLGEQYIQNSTNQYLIVRTSWLYSKYGNNFYKTILKKSKTEKIIRVTDQQKGCPTDAKNLAEFVIEKIQLGKKENGIEHFTDGEAMTWYDFAKKILDKECLEKDTEIIRDNKYTSFARRPKNSILI